MQQAEFAEVTDTTRMVVAYWYYIPDGRNIRLHITSHIFSSSVVLVRERSIPTERTLLVGEVSANF
jgi:hypothetical protein